MREDYLISMANLVNGSLLGYEDRSRVPEYEKTVDDYVDSLEEKNQKYKEIIDKINTFLNQHEKINRKLYFKYNNKYLVSNIREDIKNILKEVK